MTRSTGARHGDAALAVPASAGHADGIEATPTAFAVQVASSELVDVLDEARALADPSHKPGRKGAKA